MFRAAIFDMDGLLIDSEPFWRHAEREVFGAASIEISEDMEAAVVARVAEHIRASAAPLPGVREILAWCAQAGWRIGLASNSPAILCQLVLRELDIAPAFHAVVSADLVEEGKPDPAIYLLAARLLDVTPEECLVFEDSITGLRAARAAGMSVVLVPAPGQSLDDVPGAHLTLGALHEFTQEHAQALWARRS
jgi:mannitol-1-/sugar-/sorbitol-6-/2-deoxyglucose-6-phosphatase